MGDKCGRQVEDKCKIMRPKAPKCEGQVGDKCKIMRPKAPRVGDKCGRQVWETSEDSCSPKNPEWETSVRDKWETSVNSCGPRQPEWETSVGVKWETSGRQVQAHAAQGTQSGSVGDKCGRQV